MNHQHNYKLNHMLVDLLRLNILQVYQIGVYHILLEQTDPKMNKHVYNQDLAVFLDYIPTLHNRNMQ